METWTTLLRLDPASPMLPALCALMALTLVATILFGFGLLRRAEGAPSEQPSQAAPRELGVRALWRLGRAAGAGERRPVPLQAAPGQPRPLPSLRRGSAAAIPGEHL